VEATLPRPRLSGSQRPPFSLVTQEKETIMATTAAVKVRDTAAATTGGASPSKYMLLGRMEFYTYDGVNLVLPDIAGTLGLSQDQASWILTT
jgi:hypothetical protein